MQPLNIPNLPEFTVNTSKNGYEIRSDILKIAKDLMVDEFHAKFAGWEVHQYKDSDTGQIIASVSAPEFPGIEKVLEAAEKMYAFVDNKPRKK